MSTDSLFEPAPRWRSMVSAPRGGVSLISIALCLLLTSYLWTGCTAGTKTQLSVHRELRTHIEPDLAIAIVPTQEANPNQEGSFLAESVDCIRTAIRSAYPTVPIISPEEVHLAFFPNLPPKNATLTREKLSAAIEDADLRRRIMALGVYYLIVLRGFTEENTRPFFVALPLPPTAIISGIGATWDRSSQLTATVFDLGRFSCAGEISVRVTGQSEAACVGALFLCVPLASIAFTESTACKELGDNVANFLAGDSPPDMTHVYAADDRVRYTYNPGADPVTRYWQALVTLPHPLDSTEDPNCPTARLCTDRYIEETRRRAEEVGYKLTSEDEDDFRKDLELAVRIDSGNITRQEAFLWRRNLDGGATIEEILNQEIISRCKLPRQTAVSQKLRVAIHKLTNDLLNEVGAGADGVIEDMVKKYIKEVRQLAASFDYRLMCFDDETFQLERAVANAADADKITRETAIKKLEKITLRHLLNLYTAR